MKTEDLFAEQTCPRCGNAYKKAVSFCPHCGYVKEESWLDALTDLFGAGGATGTSQSHLISAVMSGLVGLYLLVDALRKGSLGGLLIAAIALIIALRAWILSRRAGESTDVVPHSAEYAPETHEVDDAIPLQKFFCENCGTEVTEDARECPKCGMKFG